MTEADDFSVIGADGLVLREYDDVVLLRAAASSGSGNVVVADVIPAGTVGTIIMVIDADAGLVQLECSLGTSQFAFAQEHSNHLRLLRRREEKLNDVKH